MQPARVRLDHGVDSGRRARRHQLEREYRPARQHTCTARSSTNSTSVGRAVSSSTYCSSWSSSDDADDGERFGNRFEGADDRHARSQTDRTCRQLHSADNRRPHAVCRARCAVRNRASRSHAPPRPKSRHLMTTTATACRREIELTSPDSMRASAQQRVSNACAGRRNSLPHGTNAGIRQHPCSSGGYDNRSMLVSTSSAVRPRSRQTLAAERRRQGRIRASSAFG